MSAQATTAQVERFRALVAYRLGLQFEDAKMGWLADVLGRRMQAQGKPAEAYLTRLQAAAPYGEFGELAQELTVAETYFFRSMDQLHALRERVLHQRERGERRSLNILSAGCASGEEAYSIAMTLRELPPEVSREVLIRAVDLNPVMITKARLARYTDWSLRETPLAMRQRWFRPDGPDFLLDNKIREAVKFEQRNLNEDAADLWLPGAYDFIFCRNVLMYFTPQGAQAVVARMARALTPEGYLFLGHAETLRGVSQAFHLQHSHNCFYYQRKGCVEQGLPEIAGSPDIAGPEIAAAVDSSDSWVEAISRAAGRVRALTDVQAPPTAACWSLGRALDLFRRERFADALGLVRELPAEAARDPDVLLLHAVLLAHSGNLAAAEDTGRQLLAIDELNAGAYYVLALCREGAGDLGGAADLDQAAIYLDPAFAMPRMHLGLLARRTGDHETARRELGHAAELLQREEASRLLLFGGGFNRDALFALCRTELQACAGAP